MFEEIRWRVTDKIFDVIVDRLVDPLNHWVADYSDTIAKRTFEEMAKGWEEVEVYTMCPACGGQLEIDLEYMQDNYGEDWFRVPNDERVYWCETCEEAGTYADLDRTPTFNG